MIYHLDEEETPYLVKIPVPAERITLGDFKKQSCSGPASKYFSSHGSGFRVSARPRTGWMGAVLLWGG